jgi:hypothetical protein
MTFYVLISYITKHAKKRFAILKKKMIQCKPWIVFLFSGGAGAIAPAASL